MKPIDWAEKVKRQEQMRAYRRIGIFVAGFCVIVGGALCLLAPQISSILSFNSNSQDVMAAAVVASTTPTNPDAYSHVSLIAKSAIVYDLTDGKTLYAQNAYQQLPLASITKLLTLYAASSALTPDSVVTMTPVALSQDGDAADIGFRNGETFDYEDLARLTLAASSNDGAEAIAEAADAAQNTTTTALLANAASQLSLTQTYANNSNGLDISSTVSGGYGSAHDIAILAGALVKKAPDIAAASTLPSISVTSQQGIVHTFANTDVDVEKFPNLLLSKTGETDLAGGNLVIVYDAGIDHPIAIVVLGSTEDGRFTDVQQLMEATLAYFGDATGAAGGAGTTTP